MHEHDRRRRLGRTLETNGGEADSICRKQREPARRAITGRQRAILGPVDQGRCWVVLRHAASISPSSVAGGVPLRYSDSRPRQLLVASNRPSNALIPHTTRSRITYEVGMFSFLISSPYRPCRSMIVCSASAVHARV